MRSNPIITILVAFAAAIYAIVDVMMGYTGPLAIAAKWMGIGLVVASFVRPKAGLFILGVLCFYGDFYKKLAVVYGTASMQTVIEVLAINMAVVCAIIAGTLNKIFLNGRAPHKSVIMVWLLSLFISGLLMLTEGPLSGRAQLAVNGGLYLALAGVIGYQYPKPGESLAISRLHYLLGIPWVFVAVHQYFYGFADMDYVYARTNLSPVFSAQFFMENARVFGLAGSASAYGAVTLLLTYGLWRVFQPGTRKVGWLIGSGIYFIGLVVSTQRTSLLQPLIVLVVWRLFTHRSSTRAFYMVTVCGAVLLISLSNVLLNSLEPVDAVLRRITGDHGWAAQVVRVSTFADRLKGWTRLMKPESYSLFGTKQGYVQEVTFDDDDYAHDMINSVLMNHGVVGLLACIVVMVVAVRKTHAMVFQVKDERDRSTLAFILANLTINLLLTMMGGSNIHTVPINLIFATLAGHAVAILARHGTAATQAPAMPAQVAPRVMPWGMPDAVEPGWRRPFK
ncbi:hypothetical protein [Prosthecobacter vanneervenii]|uniref:O-Antigen ligase n=1 Tax=Prosthecobacter vanneervenii TaxID=48466 RepID=A0A7W7YF58_9BACT|nr:hypothetical protein [Prosthecobacter vanneervenii]MBB5035023.1 hypothetical protein [Prosthecobacter vanneervenii]